MESLITRSIWNKTFHSAPYLLMTIRCWTICRHNDGKYGTAWKQHLTHWGQVMHICISKLTIIGSDNGLSPGWRQAIIWTNGGISFIRPLGTNFSEILIGVQTFSFKKTELKMSSDKWSSFCLSLNELKGQLSFFSRPHQESSVIACGSSVMMLSFSLKYKHYPKDLRRTGIMPISFMLYLRCLNVFCRNYILFQLTLLF